MDKLVIMHDQQAVTTSLQVAETFAKEPSKVNRSIEQLIEESGGPKMASQLFSKGEYTNRGKQYPMYYMSRDGFTLLAMGFTGKKAMEFKLEYINAFNSMERDIQYGGFHVPATYTEALRFAADQQEQIAKMQPKVEYFDKQMHNPGLLTSTVVARAFGKSATWLNRWLEQHKVIYRQGKTWVAYQMYASQGYCNYENWADDDNEHVHALLKWTQKGQKLIYDLLEEEGYMPTAVTMTLDAPLETERETND